MRSTVSPETGPDARQQFVEKDAEGIDVHGGADVLANHLFGRHVIRRAHHVAGTRHGETLRFGDPEIHELDGAAGGQVNVLWFDIAVHDVERVDISKGSRDLERDAQLGWQVAQVTIPDGMAEIFSPQKLHDHEGVLPFILPEIVDADDVVVLDIAGQAGFLQEPRLGVGIGASRIGENLDHHGAAENGVARAVDIRHPAAQTLFELVFSDASGKLQSQRQSPSLGEGNTDDFLYNGDVRKRGGAVHLPRNVIAVGLDALRKTVEILAVVEAGKQPAAVLAGGVQWGADRMILSIEDGCVRFVIGNMLYRQDQADFLGAEFPARGAFPRRAAWLRGLSRYEMPFCMGLAGELPLAWPGITSACAFLDRFSHFYQSHRTRIELARRQLLFVAEGLLALQRWPSLLGPVMDSMGDRGAGKSPEGTGRPRSGRFPGPAADWRATRAALPWHACRTACGSCANQTHRRPKSACGFLNLVEC